MSRREKHYYVKEKKKRVCFCFISAGVSIKGLCASQEHETLHRIEKNARMFI